MKTAAIFLLILSGFLGAQAADDAPHAKKTPSAILEKEHSVILMVVNAMRGDVEKLRKGEPVDPERVEKALDFFTNFADACHHRKEEDLYFPAAESVDGALQHIRTSEFLSEHAHFRFLLGQIREGLQGDAVSPKVAGPLSAYLASVSEHIRKENELLFAAVRPKLTDSKEQELVSGFAEVEKSLGPNFHQTYHQIALELSGQDTD